MVQASDVDTDNVAAYSNCKASCDAFFNRHNKDSKTPAWLILDANHRRRYTLESLNPGADLSQFLQTDLLFQASNLQEMAQVLHLDEACFLVTIRRWNAMCEEGVDEDFQKGKDAYQRFLGDPNVQSNPNMGSVSKVPFYTVAIWPGDIGTQWGQVGCGG
ncbi:succinate dehydrogenase/fumarate reductase flavoprotein [Dactylonectria estremocensis]|uniref:Succinate dehydrogenase/fumarate reductase flavoprotein n=1 Tax=Dactylonectria estremocensis TaxID=1079267 RepID=A0A9P9DJG6_9HYPO|nr:succinate dehydrogenase/fumarate reductase flavoprotein [Dactylonectria estremocensis]